MPRVRRGRVWIALPACMLAVSLAGCDPFGFTSEADRGGVDQSLAEAIQTEGRVECMPYATRNFWSCKVESDPGSGWSGHLHLRINKKGCWRARYVRYDKSQDFTAPQSDLSFGSFEAHGRTIRGCADIES